MWSVLWLIGLTMAAPYVAGIASTVDEKSGKFFSSFAPFFHLSTQRDIQGRQ